MTRDEWDARKQAGLCPECRAKEHTPNCRKRWFDNGWHTGYHDGANGLEERADSAFLAELYERGEIEEP